MIILNSKEMNVNNRLFKIFCLFVLFNLYYSCKYNNNKDEEENTYQILSLLLNEYTANSKKLTFTIPPPPNGTKSKYNFSVKDSLSLYKRFYEETIKQKVIALESKMFEMNEKYYFKEDCNVNQKLLQSFFNLKHSKNINLDKIVLHKKDSLIYYTDNHRKMQTRGFDEIDICLNFSRISFDRNHKQAILILGISYSKLNGFSAMYFLEKRKGNWYIKCVKELGIS